MKTYTAKTVDEAVQLAAQDLGVMIDDVIYTITEEKKGLFSKKAVIEVYEINDAVTYAQEYIVGALAQLGIEATTTFEVKDKDIIKITINSNHNPIVIGKNGRTLQALNELAKIAVSGKFKRRFRILLDVGDYKSHKCGRIVYEAKRLARDVQKTKITATLDPMPADERREVHNALANMSHIKTESKGEGTHRAISIIYVD